MPYNYIEESKVDLSSMNLEEHRTNRFKRTNRFLSSFGGRMDRRRFESPERKRNRLLPVRYYSESRYKSPGHMMPKMIERRLHRCNSFSIERMKAK